DRQQLPAGLQGAASPQGSGHRARRGGPAGSPDAGLPPGRRRGGRADRRRARRRGRQRPGPAAPASRRRMSGPEVRTLSGRDELQALAVTQGHAFGIFRSDDDVEERAELLAHVTCRGAFVDGRMVGTALDWTPRLSLPGGPQLTTVALSMIGVLPTHRRRGVMRELLDAQIAGAREQGIAVAALTASEATIYGRFGFGQSTVQLSAVEVDTVHGAFVAGHADR